MDEGMNIENFSPGGMEVQIRAEYDVQIMTAQKIKRDLVKVSAGMQKMACQSPEMAASCFYSLPRKDANGKIVAIEGPSIRFAEIAIYNWTNLRAGGRVVNVEDKFVDVEGVCHDLQTNNLIVRRVRRNIMTKTGGRFSDDMVNVTANAGISIAVRNAALTVIPGPIWKPIFEETQKFAKGDAKGLKDRLLKYVASFSLIGVTVPQLLRRLGRPAIEAVTLDDLGILMGLYTSIKEEEVRIQDVFEAVDNPVYTMRTENEAKAAQPATAAPAQEAAQPAPAAPVVETAAPQAEASRAGFAAAQNNVAFALELKADEPEVAPRKVSNRTATTPKQRYNMLALQITSARDAQYCKDVIHGLLREHGGEESIDKSSPANQEKILAAMQRHLEDLQAEARAATNNQPEAAPAQKSEWE